MAASGRLIDYLGSGNIADRPVTPTLFTGTVGLWWSVDTTTLSAWDGSAWADVSGGSGSSPITTEGDLIVGDVAGAPDRLPIGASGYVLTSDGTTADWAAPGAGSGDVVGPASATDGHVVLFDGTSGKLLKDGGLPAADRSTVTVVTPASGTATFDYSLGDYFTVAPTANITTVAFSNLPGSGHGASLMIRFTQDTTPRTVTWPASFKWAGGTAGAVSTASGAIDVLAITTFDNGTTWDATLAKAFA